MRKRVASKRVENVSAGTWGIKTLRALGTVSSIGGVLSATGWVFGVLQPSITVPLLFTFVFMAAYAYGTMCLYKFVKENKIAIGEGRDVKGIRDRTRSDTRE